jgi:hypothetical protein
MMNELANATVAAPAPADPLAGVPAGLEAPQAPAAPVALPSPLDAVQAGQLPAVSLTAFAEGDPLHEFVVANFNALPDLGLDYAEFEGTDGVSAIFNPAKITEADLKAAYKAGKLEQVAPPAAAAMEAAAAPAPAPEAALAAEAPAAAAPLAGVSLPAPNAPAGVQEARARNLQAVVAPKVNTPTGGPGAAMARRAF